MFSVTVSYTGELDSNLDKRIIESVGGEFESSGYGFGERDLSFDFPIVELAEEARVRALQISGVQVSEVQEYSEDDDWLT